MITIYHVFKDRADPNYKNCWEVFNPKGIAYTINLLQELRQSGLVLHKGFIKDQLPSILPIDDWVSSNPSRFSVYWFKK